MHSARGVNGDPESGMSCRPLLVGNFNHHALFWPLQRAWACKFYSSRPEPSYGPLFSPHDKVLSAYLLGKVRSTGATEAVRVYYGRIE